ncbi:MAG: M3 family oligoendopeptidase [Chloroflexi bacterium]|nr:M3 family oligoendopeptidase [Chloroflexota bacterium]
MDELNVACLVNLKEEFDATVDAADWFKYDWVSIPHIYGTKYDYKLMRQTKVDVAAMLGGDAPTQER